MRFISHLKVFCHWDFNKSYSIHALDYKFTLQILPHTKNSFIFRSLHIIAYAEKSYLRFSNFWNNFQKPFAILYSKGEPDEQCLFYHASILTCITSLLLLWQQFGFWLLFAIYPLLAIYFLLSFHFHFMFVFCFVLFFLIYFDSRER